LEPFKGLMMNMSSSTKATVVHVIPLFNIILDHLEDTASRITERSEGWEARIRKAAEATREKVVQYYSKTNTTTMLCTVLDPRRKLRYFTRKGFSQDDIDATEAL
jgi:Domain of unknown function (DUF4413)